jgi:outer membrane protein
LNLLMGLGAVFAALASPGGKLQVADPSTATANALTLQEAIAIAEGQAFGLRIAETDLRRQRALVDEARARFSPRVDAGATYTRLDRAGVAQLGPEGPRVVVQPADQAQGTLGVTVPIDLAGRLRLGVDAARSGLRAAERNVEAERNDLRREVRRGYYQVLQSRALVRVSAQAVELAEERLRTARVQFEARAVPRVDVIRAETLLAQAESDAIAARSGDQMARQAFNLTLARPIETPFEPVEVPEPVPVAPNVAQLAELAIARRPEIQALAEQAEALDAVRRIEGKGLAPTLGLSANYQRSLREGGLTSRADQATATLALNFPLFDGGQTRARARAAAEDVERVRVLIEQTRLLVSLEVRQAATAFENAASRLEVTTEQARLAEENFRLARVRYDAGEAILLEVVDAQTELTRARTSMVAARYDLLSAYADLQRAVAADEPAPPGTDRPGTRSPGQDSPSHP